MDLEKIDWKPYIDCNRGLLIAPAGHGKTTAIADCILQCPDNTCQLVLTHTHAGITSLREKFKSKKISSAKYHLDTITGFAQRYVLAYKDELQLPSVEDNTYFLEVVRICIDLMNTPLIQKIINISYDGIFVDEYQDCTIDQHKMILSLAKNLPLHILGDHLQGIFSFEKTPLVDFEIDLKDFKLFNCLEQPWRWYNTNVELGNEILSIRKRLESHKSIQFSDNCKGLQIIHHTCPADLHNKDFLRLLRSTIENNIDDSFLIIYPSYKETQKDGKTQFRGNIKDRINLKIAIDLGFNFRMIDAIDFSKYYSCSKQIDEFLDSCQMKRKIQKIKHLCDIMEKMFFGLTAISDWIDKDKNRIKQKRKQEHKQQCEKLQQLFSSYENTPNLYNLMLFIDFVYSLTKKKCHFKEFYNEIKRASEIALDENISLYEGMIKLKNNIRHIGRKINGKCIGTTLLTKGLEFDTVVLFEANKFTDTKNFYVAISRARKKLIVITSETIMRF